MYRCWIVALVTVCLVGTAQAQESKPGMSAAQFDASLKYQQGEIRLPNGVATLKIPDEFRYLDPADAKRVIEQAWGNPDGSDTQGMLFPKSSGPLDKDGWGVVITYEEEGHVSDDDADKINYDDLLKQMQQSTAEASTERKKQGFTEFQLIGWAARPYYDQAAKKLYWAKELKFGDSDEHTLNYNIRILGRKGVLVLNAVSGMNQLDMIRNDMKSVLAFTNFSTGSSYADFKPDVDKVATYGLAALVAGGIAAKAGLFAKFIALLIAFKKIILVAVLAGGGYLARLFKRKPANDS
jgi:uncharacterized membrane-anchored protein